MIRALYDYIIIMLSGLFDRKFYLQSYADVRRADTDPLWHFVRRGWKEGRNPSRDFDTIYYGLRHQDVQDSNLNPLVHYIKHGRQEFRPTNPNSEKHLTDYQIWLRQYDALSQKDIEQIKKHLDQLKNHPLISIILTASNPDLTFLSHSLASLRDQIYEQWECCVLVMPPILQKEKNLLDHFSAQDSRIKILYFQENQSTEQALVRGLESISGEYVAVMGQYDLIEQHALYLIANEINQVPQTAIVYSDHDQIDPTGYRFDPTFKPDWNPDLALAHNFPGCLCFFRVKLLTQIGGFNASLHSASEWDVLLRMSERVSTDQIRHIPYLLYHQRTSIQNNYERFLERENQLTSQKRMLTACFERRNIQAKFEPILNHTFWRIIYPVPDPPPLVSVIIPTRDQLDLLRNCINSIIERTSYPNYEIIVVNNQSTDLEVLHYFKTIAEKPNLSVIDDPRPFNYSAINNMAAQAARGEVLLFLNDDIEIISSGWMEEMVRQALRTEIGAVGAMLYYPNHQIQHAGVILGIHNTAGHAFQGQPMGTCGHAHRACLVQNYSAVTAACLAITRAKFISIGGFNEKDLAIALNDIDLCLRLQSAGFRNLWTPHAELYHLESATRGSDQTLENNPRYLKEVAYFKQTHRKWILHDPAYNPNLTLDYSDFSLASPPRQSKPWSQADN